MARLRVNWQAVIEYEAVIDVPDNGPVMIEQGEVYGATSDFLMNYQIPENCLGTDARIVRSIDLAV